MRLAPNRAPRSHLRRPHRRFHTLGSTVLAAILAVVTAVPIASAAPAEGVAVLRLDGRGHGHGVGLSQWGAHAMARDGADVASILGHYYPGTSIDTAGGEIVVVVSQGARTLVSLPQGGELRSARSGAQAEGFPVALAPGEVVAVHHDGSGYRVERGGVRGLASDDAQTFQADDRCVLLCAPDAGPEPEPEPEPEDGCVVCGPAPGGSPSEPPPEGPDAPDPGSDEPDPAPASSPEAPRSPTPVWAVPADGGTVRAIDRGRTYRGLLEITGGPGALRVRNHVDVEDYLRGMAEVPGTWPAAAVQAQTVAARTYALRAMAGGGEICDSESCQVYVGVARESAGQDAAVAATGGWVVTHGGGLAATFYSASAGGHSATVQEGFGTEHDIPYLQARPEPTDDTRPWELEVSLADVASRLGYPGTVHDVRVDATGPSGRPLAMTLEGDAGDRPVDPQTFRRRLGLRSTFFTAETSTAGVAPPPPPPPVEQDQLVSATEAAGASVATGTRPPRGAVELAAPRSLPPAGPAAAARAGRAAVISLAALVVLAATMARWKSRSR